MASKRELAPRFSDCIYEHAYHLNYVFYLFILKGDLTDKTKMIYLLYVLSLLSFSVIIKMCILTHHPGPWSTSQSLLWALSRTRS